MVVAASGRQEIIECARALADKGTRIIITRKGTQRIVEEISDLKVVGLNNSLFDYLQMLKKRGLHTPGWWRFSPTTP